MTTDHDRLREAIKTVRARAIVEHDGTQAAMVFSNAVETVCLAAAQTLPKTKMVETHHVEWFQGGAPYCKPFLTKREADEWARGFDSTVSCIRVTGPHMQEVPA
jgi:hypothetical protein